MELYVGMVFVSVEGSRWVILDISDGRVMYEYTHARGATENYTRPYDNFVEVVAKKHKLIRKVIYKYVSRRKKPLGAGY